MVFKYDVNASILRTCVTFGHTVVPCTVACRGFWGFLAFHILVKIVYHLGLLPGVDREASLLYLSWHEIGIISAIMTFFEVFYTNQCYSRYLRLYDLTRKLM